MKQVPACEYNPFEAVQTNVLGAQNVIDAAIDAGVQQVVALSTDKAVNPVNLYGATKLCAEKLFVAGQRLRRRHGDTLRCVRYGNVVGSRGSVVPLFRAAAASGPPHDHRRPHDALLDHARRRRSISCCTRSSTCTAARSSSRRSRPCGSTDLAEAIAPGVPRRVDRHPPRREAARGADHRRTRRATGRRRATSTSCCPSTPGGHGHRSWPAGRRVADGFAYASDTNDQWLDARTTCEALADVVIPYGRQTHRRRRRRGRRRRSCAATG